MKRQISLKFFFVAFCVVAVLIVLIIRYQRLKTPSSVFTHLTQLHLDEVAKLEGQVAVVRSVGERTYSAPRWSYKSIVSADASGIPLQDLQGVVVDTIRRAGGEVIGTYTSRRRVSIICYRSNFSDGCCFIEVEPGSDGSYELIMFVQEQ